MDTAQLKALASEFDPSHLREYFRYVAQPAIFDYHPGAEGYTWVFDAIVDALEIAAEFFTVGPEAAFVLFIDKIVEWVVSAVVDYIFGDASDSPEASAGSSPDDIQDQR
jgi:hypothetical protein